MIVAIDGPAGAGKTTAAKGLSRRLGIPYLDTGATFRAIGLKALREGISLEDGPRLADLAASTHLVLEGGETNRVLMDGEDVSEAIRDEPISRASSVVAAQPELRRVLVALWRELAQARGAVLEGRDIGTVVFPDADIKFFLDASPAARAGRRFSERNGRSGRSLAQTADDLEVRDEADSSREHAPLRRAVDAVVIDTTELTPASTLDRLADEVLKRLPGF